MFSFVILLLLFLIFIFGNMLFYVISLLVVSVIVLVNLVSYGLLSVLSLLLILIVYLGAIIILIGYICAVVPNFNLSSTYSPSVIFVLFIFTLFFYFSFSSPLNIQDNQFNLDTLLDFFFSEWGFYAFFTIVFMLFFTLLIVTSQYSSPQGPFRSL